MNILCGRNVMKETSNVSPFAFLSLEYIGSNSHVVKRDCIVGTNRSGSHHQSDKQGGVREGPGVVDPDQRYGPGGYPAGDPPATGKHAVRDTDIPWLPCCPKVLILVDLRLGILKVHVYCVDLILGSLEVCIISCSASLEKIIVL